METAHSAETLAAIYKTTRCHSPEHQNINLSTVNLRCRVNYTKLKLFLPSALLRMFRLKLLQVKSECLLSVLHYILYRMQSTNSASNEQFLIPFYKLMWRRVIMGQFGPKLNSPQPIE
jgi:hypothetical protein